MSGPQPVAHWSQLPLAASGRSLVEASAGTGKTWTIAVLYLRLLLEQPLAVEQVVVTTFTDAAAQELRERLRARLRHALWLSENPPASDVPPEDEAWLRARWRDAACLREDRRRLRLALADFDRAPVGTLHGLCQRILAEHPFESGSRFEVGDPTSGQALADELARDAWRVLHQGDGAAAAGIALEDLKLAGFGRQLKQLMAPGVRIDAEGEDLPAVLAALPEDLVSGLRDVVGRVAWFARSNSALRTALTALADCFAGEGGWPKEDHLALIRDQLLDKQVRPEHQAAFLAHPAIAALFGGWPRIEATRFVPLQRFWRAQVEQAQRWRDERLAARGQVTFDEMIRRAHAAIAANPALADALFRDWPVALVDEFQDTDAQQYGILDRLYRDADGAPRGRLVMIGDPKQAIYGFRGGDIHAYRRARGDAGHVLVLGTNHRSSRGYVQAVNQWYAAGGETLGRSGADDVNYRPVEASDRRDGTPYTIGGRVLERPLQVHFHADDPGRQGERRRQALDACANQIAAMLASGQHAIGGRPLEPGDLAVLLPTNRDIASLRARLQARGVPCVGGARDSVFAGDWAFELQLVLSAVLAEEDESALRAALLTRLWGYDLAMLAALDAGSPRWAAVSDRLQRLRHTWRAKGVLALVQQLAVDAAPRLLATPGGERDLTDLRHLGELLQQRSEQGGGARELLAWLGEQRRGDGDEDSGDERQPRIESDARRVQLMSLHKSKGLEFPVVFLPLMWAHEGQSLQAPYLVPLREGGRRAAFDDAAKAIARWEGQDERFRTLYVALTRAIHACHVYALPPERAQAANSQKPKADPERAPLDAMLARVIQAGLQHALPQVAWNDAGWPLVEAQLPRVTSSPPTRVALSEPVATPLRQRLSFSTLISGLRLAATEEAPADDEPTMPGAVIPEPADEPPHPELSTLANVRGTAFGNALHAAFEHRRQDRPLARQHALLIEQLRGFGVRAQDTRLESVVAPLAQRMDGALAAELLPGLRLGEVPAAKQRAEMAFHFALDAARLSRLRAACAANGEPDLVPPLAAERLRGLMTGKIDLVFEHAGVFHVLDYKGNWLGERLSDYRGHGLRAAMDHSHYRMQALLYTVALHRFLRQRLPDYVPAKQLGAYIYMYVRAAGLAPGAGIFVERFSDGLIHAVDAVLAETEAGA
ncbi:UvrD-helicase domain-containing protein [Arenimonas terrae]|uniref:RecBCD enzyme subunit RecB n=1 Tax=Arenimonas terrae TaxID=2546226 RepID=A0A5C4RNU1_9GAMM|nr:UvrD-helicase domain-containing protein [Arenimonas terrae]TNJ32913.1 DNA helicase UvrD [Arenimonas terrae]